MKLLLFQLFVNMLLHICNPCNRLFWRWRWYDKGIRGW